MALYVLFFLFITVTSYAFVDANFPWQPPFIFSIADATHRVLSTTLYTGIIAGLFMLYGHLLRKVRDGSIGSPRVWRIILIGSAILFFSYPAFSHDIFNYIATARVLFLYGENPYIIMPIELTNEPILAYMHAPNKTALYGPLWIILTAFPHFASLGNPILSVFMYKAFILLFYLGCAWAVWILGNRKTFPLAFFALNPLVVIESLVSAHNDVVMMFFALSAFLLIRKNLLVSGIASFIFSVLIKFATGILSPLIVWLVYLLLKNERIKWNKIWLWSTGLMFVVFLLSPLREEIYSWYFIWVLAFVALLPWNRSIHPIALAFSFGVPLRIVPYLATGSWFGLTPVIKSVVTFLPPLITGLWKWVKK